MSCTSAELAGAGSREARGRAPNEGGDEAENWHCTKACWMPATRAPVGFQSKAREEAEKHAFVFGVPQAEIGVREALCAAGGAGAPAPPPAHLSPPPGAGPGADPRDPRGAPIVYVYVCMFFLIFSSAEYPRGLFPHVST